VTITGVDYAFQGAPATAAVGTSFTLVNGGTELHELVLVRKNADVPQTFDELLAMPQDQVMGFITVVGGLMAAPGANADGSVTADKPGDYAMICFIPKGTTSLTSPAVGPPHFTLGMVQLLTVQ
jgi:plastocyanin